MILKSDIEKIKLFIQGNNDEKDALYIYSLFDKHENNSEFKQLLKNEFYEYLAKNKSEKEQNLTYLLDRIHHIIHKEEKKKNQGIVKKIYKWYSVAAAVLLIPIVLVFVCTLQIISQSGPLFTFAPTI